MHGLLYVGLVMAGVTGGTSAVAANLVEQFTWIAGTFASAAVLPFAKEAMINAIISVTGLNVEEALLNRTAAHGAAITITVTEDGAQACFPEAWDGPSAEGPLGSIGTLRAFPENGDEL